MFSDVIGFWRMKSAGVGALSKSLLASLEGSRDDEVIVLNVTTNTILSFKTFLTSTSLLILPTFARLEGKRKLEREGEREICISFLIRTGKLPEFRYKSLHFPMKTIKR